MNIRIVSVIVAITAGNLEALVGMCPTNKARLLRELSGAPRGSPDGTPRIYFAPSNPVRHSARPVSGQGGVALLALARTTLAVWDLISGRIVRLFDLSWRPADTY